MDSLTRILIGLRRISAPRGDVIAEAEQLSAALHILDRAAESADAERVAESSAAFAADLLVDAYRLLAICARGSDTDPEDHLRIAVARANSPERRTVGSRLLTVLERHYFRSDPTAAPAADVEPSLAPADKLRAVADRLLRSPAYHPEPDADGNIRARLLFRHPAISDLTIRDVAEQRAHTGPDPDLPPALAPEALLTDPTTGLGGCG